MKLYKSLIMEVRPRLQSVNVFITLTNEGNNVNVNLSIDHFEVVLDSVKQTVWCEEFRIIPDSLSCFSAEKNFVTFRFSTDNLQQDLGTSRYEIVTSKQTPVVNHTDAFINASMFYNISCANCTQLLCQKVSFERVLPLPENPDSSDWFCHTHNNKNQNLAPKTNEAFYSHCFVHVNENIVNGLLKTGSGMICKRCLAWIGTVLKATRRLWFNTVVFSNDSNSFKTCALDDVFRTVRQILNNALLSSCRIVLNCCSSQMQTDFVLLWVLEKELIVRFDRGESDGGCKANVAKVLFKFDNSRSSLISQWLNDVNVSIVDISKPMMVELLRHLFDMNRHIPKSFSISNNFHVSYLMMYKENNINK